jgi:hypothetical protein
MYFAMSLGRRRGNRVPGKASMSEMGSLASSPRAARPIARTADRCRRDSIAGESNGTQRAPMSSRSALAVVALFEVRFEAHCGLKSDMAQCPEMPIPEVGNQYRK